MHVSNSSHASRVFPRSLSRQVDELEAVEEMERELLGGAPAHVYVHHFGAYGGNYAGSPDGNKQGAAPGLVAGNLLRAADVSGEIVVARRGGRGRAGHGVFEHPRGSEPAAAQQQPGAPHAENPMKFRHNARNARSGGRPGSVRINQPR